MKVPFVDLKRQHDPIRNDLNQAFQSTLDSDWYILGEQLKNFESEYSEFNNVKYTLGVGNGLDALTISLKSLGIGKGDEVLIPSNTFIATALAVSATGAEIVLAEPDPRTYNLTKNSIEPFLTKKTKCIIPVHLYGQSCEMAEIMTLAKKMHLVVVEDNAQAQGATFNSQLTGSWGDINGTSFYPGKNLGALGDGGAVTTNSDELAVKAKLYRNYGSSERYVHKVQGTNSRLDEIQAAVLRVKLKRLSEWTSKRQEAARSYDERLSRVGDLVLPQTARGATHSYHLYVIRTIKRDELRNHLLAEGIETLIHYPIPIHRQVAYENSFEKNNFKLTEDLAKTCLSLPIFPGLTESEISKVEKSIKGFFSK